MYIFQFGCYLQKSFVHLLYCSLHRVGLGWVRVGGAIAIPIAIIKNQMQIILVECMCALLYFFVFFYAFHSLSSVAWSEDLCAGALRYVYQLVWWYFKYIFEILCNMLMHLRPIITQMVFSVLFLISYLNFFSLFPSMFSGFFFVFIFSSGLFLCVSLFLCRHSWLNFGLIPLLWSFRIYATTL